MATPFAPPVGSILGLSSSCGCGSNVGLAAATLVSAADALLKAAQEISQAAQAFSVATSNPGANVHRDIANPQSEIVVPAIGTADGGKPESCTGSHNNNKPLPASLATLGTYSPTLVQSPSGQIDELPRPEPSDAGESNIVRELNNKREIMPPSPSITELAPEVEAELSNPPLDTSKPINGGDQTHVGGSTKTLAPPHSPVQPTREIETKIPVPPKPQTAPPPTPQDSRPRSWAALLAASRKPQPIKQSDEDRSLAESVDNNPRDVPHATTSINSSSSTLPMPPGHFYIILDDPKSAFPLISYLACRSKKTICGLPPDRSFETIRNTLSDDTRLNVTHSGNRRPQRGIRGFGQQPSEVFLCPNRACYITVKTLRGDCLVCWGLLPNVRQYAYECMGEVTHTYMLLTRAEYDRMVNEQPISTCYLKPHPWAWRFYGSLGISVSPSAVVEPSVSATPASTIDQNFAPSPVVPPDCPLPEGHYCIAIDEPLDAVPLISYLALHSKRTICYLPVSNFGEPYQTLFHQVTGITTACCDGAEATKLKPAMQMLKKKPSAILLRPADDKWDVGFVKSLADSVIYWGVPRRMDHFRADCSLKTTRSYLVVTRLQYDELFARNPGSYYGFQHPSIDRFNDEGQGSVLHDLRLKTSTTLAGMMIPPISKDQYKDMLSRRGILG